MITICITKLVVDITNLVEKIRLEKYKGDVDMIVSQSCDVALCTAEYWEEFEQAGAAEIEV
jgi:hypothetical protein